MAMGIIAMQKELNVLMLLLMDSVKMIFTQISGLCEMEGNDMPPKEMAEKLRREWCVNHWKRKQTR